MRNFVLFIVCTDSMRLCETLPGKGNQRARVERLLWLHR